LKNVTEFTFDETVSDQTILVKFGASWCGPCKMIKPTLQKLEDQHGLPVVEVDVDEEPELARQFRIMSIPTMLLFKNGQVVRTIVGVKPQKALEQELGLT
jgi:thioredoxin 1